MGLRGLSGLRRWPGVGQVRKVERRRAVAARASIEVADAVTSLGPTVEPAELLVVRQGHRATENRLHYVRDVTLGEAACHVHTRAAP